MNFLQKTILSVVTIGFFSSYSYVLHAQELGLVAPPPVVADTLTVAPPTPQPEITAPALPAIHTDNIEEDTEELTVEHSRALYDDSDEDDESGDLDDDDD